MSNPIKHKLQLEIDTQKVSVKEMAEKIGRSRSWWYDVTDSSLGVEELLKIAKYLKKPVSFFLGEAAPLKDEKEQLREMVTNLTVQNNKLIDMVNRKDQEIVSLRKAGASGRVK